MRRAVGLLAVGAVVIALVGPASGAETTTEHLKRETETFTDELPCVGQAVLTITYNAVFHTTENKNGEHMTGTLTGKFSADPVESGVPNYTGRFTQWFGSNVRDDGSTETFTFSVTGKASDGSGRIRFHQVAHATENKNGTIVEFDRTKC